MFPDKHPSAGIELKKWSRRRWLAQSRENEQGASSSDDSAELSELVNSFVETGGRHDHDDQTHRLPAQQEDEWGSPLRDRTHDCMSISDSSAKLHELEGLIDASNHDPVCRKISGELQNHAAFMHGYGVRGEKPRPSRSLVALLRARGFDAGLCRSRWEKAGRFPSGVHEYVDVNDGVAGGGRYIVEVNLAGEFQIARPTNKYAVLLAVFPDVFVGKLDDLRKIVKLMCRAGKESMEVMEMPLPPWRRNGYVLAKWFGHYERTTFPFADHESMNPRRFVECFDTRNFVGFEGARAANCTCRDGFPAGKDGLVARKPTTVPTLVLHGSSADAS